MEDNKTVQAQSKKKESEEVDASTEKKINSYKIVHDRPGCIGCAACTAVADQYWEMKEDGKSSIKHPKMKHEGDIEILEHDEHFDVNLEAAQVCPVNVIHIEKEGKRVI